MTLATRKNLSNATINQLQSDSYLPFVPGMPQFEPLRVSDSEEGEPLNEDDFLPADHQSQLKPRETTTRPRNTIYETWVQNGWLVEIMSLTVGIVSIIAICIVLVHYQNKPTPKIGSIIGVASLLTPSLRS